MNKIEGDWIDLEPFANDFLYEFSKCIKKDNRVKYFQRIVY